MSSYNTTLITEEDMAEMYTRLQMLKEQNEELIKLGSTGEEQSVREGNIKIYDMMIKTQSKFK
jgi:hypothetical protein